MPKYRITSPDGRTFEITAPDGASKDQVLSFAQSQMKIAPQPSAADNDPSKGELNLKFAGFDTGIKMPEGVSQFMAGTGKAFTDLARGTGQLVGKVSRSDIEEARKLDAPLMKTAAGQVGNVAGNIAAFAPTAFVPGANTYTGAALIGGLSGLLAPSASTGETLQNIGGNAVMAPATMGLVRGAGALYQGGKALVEPFYKAGQERIASRVLKDFAQDPTAAILAARSAPAATATGAQPTLAEATKDVGIAQLQRGLQSANPTEFGNELAVRLQANNAARVNALRQIAGDDAGMQAAINARDAAANNLYGQAFTADAMRRDLAQSAAAARAPFKGAGLTAPPEDLATNGLRELAKRPMFKQAADKAVELAANNGVALKDPLQSLQGLHYIKLALDDMANPTAATAMGRNASGAVNDMRSLLTKELETVSPLYGNARATYADMSKPINQMEVGQRLLNQFTSATNDLSGNPRLRAEAFNRALRNEEQLVKQATGFKGNQGLEQVLTPEQAATVRAIADEIGLQSAVETAGRAPGSPTAQNLASQNVLRQLLGPTGLPQSWSENAMLMTLARPVQWAAKAGEPKITNRLASALLDPQDGANLLAMTLNPALSQRVGNAALPFVPPVAVGFANSKQ